MSLSKFVSKGVSLYQKGDYKGSLKEYNKALEIGLLFKVQTEVLDIIYRNMGLSYASLFDYENALKHYKKCNKYDHQLKYEMSLALFHLNRFDEGLDLYENRYLKQIKFPNLSMPFINMRDGIDKLKDKTVLFLNEEGLGDELMYMRGIYQISKLVKHADVQVYPELLELFKLNINLPNITFFSGKELPKDLFCYDVYSCTGNIWQFFPKEPPLELRSFRDKLSISGIGFVHSPNKLSPNFKDRKVSEQYFKNLPGEKHSLQFGENSKFATNHQISSFVDTLQIIESLDEVQTVDTSVAHLLANSAARHSIKPIMVYNKYLDWRWHSGLYDIEVKQIK